MQTLEHLQFVVLLPGAKLSDSSCDDVSGGGQVKTREDLQFREYMIQSRKPLSVNASGMTNRSRINAEVDSSSNSTIPTAYSTMRRHVSESSRA